MSWLDDDELGSDTALQYWKESFIIAASELFKVVDNCVGMDIQVHNLGWFVQEAETARVAVQMLDESQDWFQDYLVEQSLRQQQDDADYWDDDEDEAPRESFFKRQYDELFAAMRTALANIKFLAADTEEWVKLGPQRRLGKNVWHNYRTFERSLRLHQAVLRIMDIAHLDVYTHHYSKEPNYGVARKLRHPAVRHFWLTRVAPKVLASHTGMQHRAPPALHPKLLEAHLACINAVTLAPIKTVAEELIAYLKLDKREKMILPYLLASGCCDYEYNGQLGSTGSYTMGLNPCCHQEAIQVTFPNVREAGRVSGSPSIHSILHLRAPADLRWCPHHR
jgi:hypothetical protein